MPNRPERSRPTVPARFPKPMVPDLPLGVARQYFPQHPRAPAPSPELPLKTAVLLSPDGTPTPVVPADGVAFTLPELQGFVAGNIEIIVLDNRRSMVLNEYGKLLHALKPNARATRLLHLAGGHPLDWICGTALVCHPSQLS